MENLHQFVSDIVRLWSLHQYRESLYKQAMTLENLGSLRRSCSQGYMISILFKKEILWIYDQVKSTLDDGDIQNCKMKQGLHTIIFSSEDESSITDMILEQESKTIRLYKSLLNNINLTHDASEILTEHLDKLNDINFNLKNQLIAKRPAQQFIVQNAVA